MTFQPLCSSPVQTWSQEWAGLSFIGNLLFGLLVSGTWGATFYWLLDRFVRRE